jgi:plastocyanin
MRSSFSLAVVLTAGVLAQGMGSAAARQKTGDRGSVQKVTLVATDYRFSPSTLRVVAGQPLEITITNRGTHIHGLRLVLSYGELPFPDNVPPGRTMSTVFDNLGEPGTYRFYCPVDDHADRGMHGSLIVTPSRGR